MKDLLIYLILIFVSSCITNRNSLDSLSSKIDSDIYLSQNQFPRGLRDGITAERLKNLKGDIKILKVFEYAINDDLSRGGLIEGTPTFSLVFDKSKRVIQEWGYDATEQVSAKYFIRDYRKYVMDSFLFYDNNNGSLRYGEWNSFNNDGLNISRKILKNGVITELSFKTSSSGDTTVHYNRNSIDKYYNGQLVKQHNYDSSINTQYTYFKNGNLKLSQSFTKGNISHLEKFTERGYIIERQEYEYLDSTFSKKVITQFKYDEDSRLLKRITTEFNAIKNVTKTILHLNYKNGKITEDIVNERVYGTYTYNELGDLTEKNYPMNISSYTYSNYDSKNNWCKKETSYNGKLRRITIREITYF